MRISVIKWGRARWPGCRVIQELALGDRRIDVAFISERDIIGVEIKSKKDKLDRLVEQHKEFSRYFPEIWVALAPKWIPSHDDYSSPLWRMNLIEVDGPQVRIVDRWKRGVDRDELSIARLIELLWNGEAVRIANRTKVIPAPIPARIKRDKVLPMLARLLTGNEILAEVCKELRARPLTGIGSDKPVSTRGENPAPTLFRK